ncbi:zinc finger MYND domain-containing protein [Phanerochaete sordida]|uniref:Zinc finger MYND domain-containing protein n=1 Tax=Phanerochaete sordida TaxID=48140 RepID=A0A9P3GCG1_9APHY|nr:zinc finger MYND domain-containing protein [Phanerochaete sordida]
MFEGSLRDNSNYPGLFPEPRLHTVLALAGMFLPDALDAGNNRFVDEVRGVLQLCCDLLRRHTTKRIVAPTSGMREFLRRVSRARWQAVADALRARGAHRSTQWRPLHQTWTILGRVLDVEAHGTAPVDAEEIRKAFPPLLRCNWHECMCSVHEPLHKLQVCRGCSYVAYCNDRCQRRDWTDGGHRENCAR